MFRAYDKARTVRLHRKRGPRQMAEETSRLARGALKKMGLSADSTKRDDGNLQLRDVDVRTDELILGR